MINRSYHEHSYSYWAARLIQAFVVGRQIIAEAEAEEWLQEFDELEHQGAYFFLLDAYPDRVCEGCLARDEYLSTLGTCLIPLHQNRNIILQAQSFSNKLQEEAEKCLSSFTFHSKTTKEF